MLIAVMAPLTTRLRCHNDALYSRFIQVFFEISPYVMNTLSLHVPDRYKTMFETMFQFFGKQHIKFYSLTMFRPKSSIKQKSLKNCTDDDCNKAKTFDRDLPIKEEMFNQHIAKSTKYLKNLCFYSIY